jgi:hypothetical protein
MSSYGYRIRIRRTTKGKGTIWKGEAESTEASMGGGLVHSSEESLVMREERRNQVIPVE